MTSSHAFGLSIQSNRPVPGLVANAAAVGNDVRVWLHPAATPERQQRAVAAARAHDPDGEPTLERLPDAGGHCLRLTYPDGTEFLIDRDGREVRASWLEPLTVEDTATYLLGPVMGLLLGMRGVTCLHGSAIAVGDRAIAIIGSAGAGKSTLAAAFGLMGLAVFTDDIVALVEEDGAASVVPGYPQIRLWPDSAAALCGSADALPRLTPNWEKRGFSLLRAGCRFAPKPLRLAAIYELYGREPGTHIAVRELRGRESLVAVLSNTYSSAINGAPDVAQDFEALTRLVRSVPVRRLRPNDNLSDVRHLCSAILADLEGLTCTA